MAETMREGATHSEIPAGPPGADVARQQTAPAALTLDAGDRERGSPERKTIVRLPEEAARFEADDGLDSGDSSSRLRAIALPTEVVHARATRRTPLPHVSREARHLVDGITALLWLLLLPAVLVMAAALWATVIAFGALWSLVQHVLALQFAEAATVLPTLDVSGRILLGAAGYFTLLLALRAVAAGLRANGWRRVGGLAAVIVALPAAWLFVAGTGLASSVAPFSSIPAEIWRDMILGLLLQVVALAVVVSRRPTRAPHAAKTSPVTFGTFDGHPWSADAASRSETTVRLPVVRFGPGTQSAPPDDDRPEFRISGLFVTSSQTAPTPED